MKRILFIALLALAVTAFANSASAISFTLDVPTHYTLDSRTVNTQGNAPLKNQTLDDVSGFKLLMAGSHHLGVGYERYDVKGKGVSGGGGGPFAFTTTFQFYDVVLDLPMRLLDFGLGYGVGTVNTSITTSTPPTPVAEQANASQWFASVGIPFGQHFDLHVAYHVVSTEHLKLSNTGGGGPDALDLSGHTLMAGVRLAW
ncbi:MAG TPA: hypothetical protein VF678_02905 [bacterium]